MSNGPPFSDDVASLRAKVESLTLVTTGIGLLALLFFGMLASICVLSISVFESVFSEMLNGMPLPDLTIRVIQASRVGFGIPLWALVIIPTFTAVLVLLKNRESAQSWLLAVVVTSYLIIISVVVPLALVLPMLSTVRVLDGI